MNVNTPEPTLLSHWLRRLWPLYCFLAALATFGYALYDGYQIDGDAVAYMDIADLIRAHNWHAIVDGYWNPLYPAFLAIGQTIFHPTRYTELHAYYLVNFGIFLLEMLAVVAFTDALIKLRETATNTSLPFLLDSYTLRYLGVAILVICAQRELSMGKVRPDALLLAFLIFGVTALLRHFATSNLGYAALMGIALGLAYLTKSFAFLFTLLCILALVIFRLVWQRQAATRVAASALLALLCFSIVAGPYIAALSKQKGRLDFGDSGSLNYVWYVSGTEKMHLQQDMTSSFGSADVNLKHPETRLLNAPATYSYKPFPYGTYPVWFDASFFNDHIKSRLDLQRQITRHPRLPRAHPPLHRQSPRGLGSPRPAASCRRKPARPLAAFSQCLLARALSSRHRHSLHLRHRQRRGPLRLSSSSSSCFPSSPQRASRARQKTQPTPQLPARSRRCNSTPRHHRRRRIRPHRGQLRRDLLFIKYPAGWYDRDIFRAAHALNDLGVGPGDTIACVGTRACLYDHYWARLAGVRILTEIYEPDAPLFPPRSPPSPPAIRPSTLVRREGAKVLIGYFEPGTMNTANPPVTAGWRELNDTPFYALPLNLPSRTRTETTAIRGTETRKGHYKSFW